MKALFHRINRGFTKERDQDAKEKILQLPPLPEWPPPVSSTPTSISSYKPLPDITPQKPLLPPIGEPDSTIYSSVRAVELSQDSNPAFNLATRTTSRPEPDSIARAPRKTTSGSVDTTATVTSTEHHKKVAFISPPPTPAGTEKDRTLPDSSTPTNNGTVPGAPANLKSTVSRFQATHGKDPRGSIAIAASASKTDIASAKATVTTNKATSTRTAASPYPASIRSGTPYSTMSNNSSRILAVASWSEGAEDDLVSNLGPRERTRQEVLWEIVASEERCVWR
jgi:hypothetical protein